MQYSYETMFILAPNLGEEPTDQAISKYQSLLQENGVSDLDLLHRGKRRLAYEIGGHRDGIYIQMNYHCDGSQVAILERAMRLSDEVIRYLTVKQPIREAKAEPAEEQA